MKKILLVVMLIASSNVFACDAPKESSAVTLIKAGCIFAIAKITGPVIIIPLLAFDLSRGQAAYNKANGIHHSREERAGKND